MAYNYYTEDYAQIVRNVNNVLKVDTDLLQELLEVQSPSCYEKNMITFIKTYLKYHSPESRVEQDIEGNLYISKGNTLNCTCLVAHMDEVHSGNKHRVIAKVGEFMLGFCNRYGCREGIGADDKVGIYIALEMLAIYDNLKLFFPVKEEIGCLGTKKANMLFFKDIGSLIQCDRNGDADFINVTNGVIVTTDDFLKDINDTMEAYDYAKATGTITDIGELVKHNVGVSACNLSCGYYNAHMDDELIHLPALENTLNFVNYVIEQTNGIKYRMNKVVYAPKFNKYNYGYPKTTPYVPAAYAAPIVIPSKADLVPCNKCKDFDCFQCDFFNDTKF